VFFTHLIKIIHTVICGLWKHQNLRWKSKCFRRCSRFPLVFFLQKEQNWTSLNVTAVSVQTCSP